MINSLALSLAVVLAPTGLWADVYAVGTTDDSGPGTLRSAIDQANAHAGADSILFNPALSGAIIRPQTALPALTDDETTISGDLEGDGDPDIVLDGRDLATGSGLTITGNGCEIRGLAIVRFPQRGIFLNGAGSCRIAGCHLGVNLAGTATALNDEDQVWVWNADGNTIGGTSAADRNVVAGASGTYSGIRIDSGDANVILGNYIGLRSTGAATLGAGNRGIRIVGVSGGAIGNRIGGTAVGAGNVIGGVEDGVGLHGADGTRVLGNTFGLLADGNGLAAITGQCVTVHDGSTGTVIGGLTARARNVFAGGAQSGLSVFGAGTTGTRIMGNYFGANKTGTLRRDLQNGVIVALGAGTQTIGGADPDAGNYFTPSDLLGTAQGVSVEGTRVVVQNNTFGTLPNGGGASGMGDAVALVDSTASVLDNDIAHALGNGVRVGGAASNPKVFGNRFRDCWYAVWIDPEARCQLGNLGNASPNDDGGNVFTATNDWFISNRSPNVVKAEGNRFPTNSRAAINAKIWDRQDNAAFGRVDFDPLAGGIHPTGEAGPLHVTGAAAAPAGAGAQITFTLSAPANVTAEVLNLAGRPIALVAQDRRCAAGAQQLLWSGRTSQGTSAPSGTYLVRLTARGPAGGQAAALAPVDLR